MKPLLLTLIVLSTIITFGQVPFKSPSRDVADITITTWDGNRKGADEVRNTSLDIRNNLSPFTEGSFNVQMNGSASSLLPTLKLDVIRYRLNFFTRIKDRDFGKYAAGDTIRYYIPLYIISKFTTNYDTSKISSLEDATSFLGSPFTFRLSPNFSFDIGLENVLNIGINADFRVLLSKTENSSNLDPSVGFYGSLGISYFGNGDVRDENGQSHNGTWVAAFLLYGFAGDKESKTLLFKDENDENKLKSGFELLFQFKLFDTKITKFNLNASMKYDFFDIPGQKPYSFKFGFGS